MIWFFLPLISPSVYVYNGITYTYNYTKSTNATVGTGEDHASAGITSGDVIIPERIPIKVQGIVVNFYVTEISDYAFYNTSITSISLPNTTSYIGKYAFAFCYQLNCALNLPKWLMAIDDHAFYFCTSLVGPIIPQSNINVFGTLCFGNCYNLTGNRLLEDVSKIGDYAFYNCFSLFGDELTTIFVKNYFGTGAFENCYQLKSIRIMNCEIPAQAFYNCYNIESVTLVFIMKSIGKNSFGRCYKLQKVITEFDTFESGPKKIGNGAFQYCHSLVSVDPGAISSIGNYSFYGCTNLETLRIKDCTAIYNSVFSNCTKLVLSVDFPSLSYVGDFAFYNCVKVGPKVKFSSLLNYIGESAFAFCTSILELRLNGTIKTLPKNCFEYCTNITSDLFLPNTITSIQDHCFKFCSFQGELVLPQNLEYIGPDAFSNCDGFTGDLIFPDSVTVISTGAFVFCSGFKGKLVLNKNIKTFYVTSFKTLTNITAVYYEGDNNFSDYTNVLFPDTIRTVHVNNNYRYGRFGLYPVQRELPTPIISPTKEPTSGINQKTIMIIVAVSCSIIVIISIVIFSVFISRTLKVGRRESSLTQSLL